VIQEAYVQGVSTRSVDELVKAMGMTGISKSQVSRLCAEIDDRVHAFLDRPLQGDWPYRWIDATYVKCREAGRIVAKAVIIAVAVNTEGVREVLGMAVGPSEAEPFWTDFLRALTRRGLRGVKLVIADAHVGLKAAAAKVLTATWQRCKVHFLRNALAHAGKGQRQMVLARSTPPSPRRPSRPPPPSGAVSPTSCGRGSRSSPALLDSAEADVRAFMGFPKAHRTQIHSTNPLERLNAEVKRRTDVVGLFPNEAAIVRLVGALLLEQNDEWQLQRRYMALEPLRALAENQPAKLAAIVS
jgi:putative transposase